MVGLTMRRSEPCVTLDPFETVLAVVGYIIVIGMYLRLGLVLLIGIAL